MKVNPSFTEPGLSPEDLLNHVGNLLNGTTRNVDHEALLDQLLKQFKPLNFQLLAFPEIVELRKEIKRLDQILTNSDGSLSSDKDLSEEREQRKELQKKIDRLKLCNKHYLILSIDNVLKVARQNKWGLCKNNHFIYLYNGAYWTNIDNEEFQKFLGEAAEKMGVEVFSARFYQFREQITKQFIATAYLPTPVPPKDAVLINLQNGTFEITPRGSKIRPFNANDFITYQLSFEYNPDATAPLFQSYLDRVIPDEQKQMILAEYLGYVFIQPTTLKLEKTLLLYGSGANGKSVFFDIVNALLGSKNVSSYSLQSLTNESGYQRAMLANKLVNYASEINGSLETNIFKAMVSGEPVEARLPYGDPFTLERYAKLIFNCNNLPKDVEHTPAYFRRFLIVPFDVTIPEAEQDKQLAQKIIGSELAGVFNWVLKGLNRLLEQNMFTDCEAVRKAREHYENQSDTVRLFVDEMGYKNHPTEHILIKDLYKEYREFCSDDGFKFLNKSNFKIRLQNSGTNVQRLMNGNVAYLKKIDL